MMEKEQRIKEMLISLMIKRFLKEGVPGEEQFSKCSSLRGGGSLDGRDFFLPEGKKSEGVYPEDFRFSAKHDVFSTLREEIRWPRTTTFRIFSPRPPTSKTF